MPVFCNSLTARALHDAGLVHENWKLFQTGSEFSLGSFAIRAFSVPHDAADPVGFRISSSGSCFGVLTDLGYATRLVFEMLRGIRLFSSKQITMRNFFKRTPAGPGR